MKIISWIGLISPLLICAIALAKTGWAGNLRDTSDTVELILIPAIILFFILTVLAMKIRSNRTKKLYKNFALYNGFSWTAEAGTEILQSLAYPCFTNERNWEYKKPLHIILKSEKDCRLYIFDCYSGRGKTTMYYTACLFKLNMQTGYILQITKRFSGFEKFILSLPNAETGEARTAGHDDFFKEFVINSGGKALPQSIQSDVIQYVMTNRAVFARLGARVHLFNDAILFTFRQRGIRLYLGFSPYFKEKDLREFLAFSESLKNKLLKNQ